MPSGNLEGEGAAARVRRGHHSGVRVRQDLARRQAHLGRGALRGQRARLVRGGVRQDGGSHRDDRPAGGGGAQPGQPGGVEPQWAL